MWVHWSWENLTPNNTWVGVLVHVVPLLDNSCMGRYATMRMNLGENGYNWDLNGLVPVCRRQRGGPGSRWRNTNWWKNYGKLTHEDNHTYRKNEWEHVRNIMFICILENRRNYHWRGLEWTELQYEDWKMPGKERIRLGRKDNMTTTIDWGCCWEVERWTDDREVQGSNHAGNLVYPTLAVSFGGDTKIRRSLLYGINARRSRRFHTDGKCVTCRGRNHS